MNCSISYFLPKQTKNHHNFNSCSNVYIAYMFVAASLWKEVAKHTHATSNCLDVMCKCECIFHIIISPKMLSAFFLSLSLLSLVFFPLSVHLKNSFTSFTLNKLQTCCVCTFFFELRIT